jgi:hypothetical protein
VAIRVNAEDSWSDGNRNSFYSSSSSSSSWSTSVSRSGDPDGNDFDFSDGGSNFSNFENNNGVKKSNACETTDTSFHPGDRSSLGQPYRRRSHSCAVPHEDYSEVSEEVSVRNRSGRGWGPWRVVRKYFSND